MDRIVCAAWSCGAEGRSSIRSATSSMKPNISRRFPSETYENASIGRGRRTCQHLRAERARLEERYGNRKPLFVGLVATLSISAGKVERIWLHPLDLKLDGGVESGRPQLADPSLGREIAATWQRNSRVYGTRIRYDPARIPLRSTAHEDACGHPDEPNGRLHCIRSHTLQEEVPECETCFVLSGPLAFAPRRPPFPMPTAPPFKARSNGSSRPSSPMTARPPIPSPRRASRRSSRRSNPSCRWSSKDISRSTGRGVLRVRRAEGGRRPP